MFPYERWRPYVPVAVRRARAKRIVNRLRKEGIDIQPIEIEGRKIVSTFWGEAWCEHLESFGDFANRLPRGRTYVRNGSVCHLDIQEGKVTALVSGSEMYNVELRVGRLGAKAWKAIRKRCTGRIGSLLELLQGRMSNQVMEVVTDRASGLFPKPRQIEFACDCPDWADMCKHVAAVCYGIGARLDASPALLFRLRAVDPHDLLTVDAEGAIDAATKRSSSKRIAEADLGTVFGIELDGERSEARAPPSEPSKKKKKKHARKKAKKRTARKAAKKKTKKAPRRVAGKKKAAARRKKKGSMKQAARKMPVAAKSSNQKAKANRKKTAIRKKKRRTTRKKKPRR